MNLSAASAVTQPNSGTFVVQAAEQLLPAPAMKTLAAVHPCKDTLTCSAAQAPALSSKQLSCKSVTYNPKTKLPPLQLTQHSAPTAGQNLPFHPPGYCAAMSSSVSVVRCCRSSKLSPPPGMRVLLLLLCSAAHACGCTVGPSAYVRPCRSPKLRSLSPGCCCTCDAGNKALFTAKRTLGYNASMWHCLHNA
jgi:hypothetical protein